MTTVVDELVVRLGLDTEGWQKDQRDALAALDKLRQAATKTTENVEASGKKQVQAYDRTHKSVVKFWTTLMSGTALMAFLKQIAQVDAALYRTAQNIGMYAENVSGMGEAMRVTGGSAESFARMMKEINQGFFELYQGGGGAKAVSSEQWRIFWKYKIPMPREWTDSATRMHATAKVIWNIINDPEIPEPSKLPWALSIRGVTEEFYNTVKHFKGNMHKAQKEMELAGIVHTRKQLEAATRLNAIYNRLMANISKLGAVILEKFEKPLTKVMEVINFCVNRMKDFIEWLGKVGEEIKKFGDYLSSDKSRNIIYFFGSWDQTIRRLRGGVDYLVSWIDNLKRALIEFIADNRIIRFFRSMDPSGMTPQSQSGSEGGRGGFQDAVFYPGGGRDAKTGRGGGGPGGGDENVQSPMMTPQTGQGGYAPGAEIGSMHGTVGPEIPSHMKTGQDLPVEGTNTPWPQSGADGRMMYRGYDIGKKSQDMMHNLHRISGHPDELKGGTRRYTGSNRDVATAAMIDQLRKEGVPENRLQTAAAHLVGQAHAESGVNPNATHDHGTGYGIYGAGKGRMRSMLAWMKQNGYPRNSVEGQSRFMAHEAMTGKSYGPTRDVLRSGRTDHRAIDTITKNFEAPKVTNQRYQDFNWAQKAGQAGTQPSQQQAGTQPSQQQSGAGPQASGNTKPSSGSSDGSGRITATTDQQKNSYRTTGNLTVNGESFPFVSGGWKRGAAPMGNYNVGGPVDRPRLHGTAYPLNGGGAISDPRYPGNPRTGIFIHQGWNSRTEHDSEGCIVIRKKDWPRFMKAMGKGNHQISLGPKGRDQMISHPDQLPGPKVAEQHNYGAKGALNEKSNASMNFLKHRHASQTSNHVTNNSVQHHHGDMHVSTHSNDAKGVAKELIHHIHKLNESHQSKQPKTTV